MDKLKLNNIGTVDADFIHVRVGVFIVEQEIEVSVVIGRGQLFHFTLNLSFPKISSVQIRAMRQNQGIIRPDACNPSSACNVRRRPVQVATEAGSRESVSAPSAQHRLAVGAVSPASARN